MFHQKVRRAWTFSSGLRTFRALRFTTASDPSTEMDRRSFLTLIASAPIAALAPLPHFLERGVTETPWPSMEPFVTLPTRFPIVHLTTVDGFLCAITEDETCWVINGHGAIVSHFSRPRIENVTDVTRFD